MPDVPQKIKDSIARRHYIDQCERWSSTKEERNNLVYQILTSYRIQSSENQHQDDQFSLEIDPTTPSYSVENISRRKSLIIDEYLFELSMLQ